VLAAMQFSTEDEAIALANGTITRCSVRVWTADLSRAHRVAAEIEAGQVYVNTYGAGGGVELPFGGFHKSGYGREKGVESARLLHRDEDGRRAAVTGPLSVLRPACVTAPACVLLRRKPWSQPLPLLRVRIPARRRSM